MDLHQFDYGVLKQTAHRPWPIPERPWLMTQSWHDLLFAHWAVDRAVLRRAIPSHFELDEFEGRTWIGIVPFFMTNVGPRGVPMPRTLSAFPELNVRTYVRADDRPGVFFFSLDAGSRLAVGAARALLNLPYFAARMRVNSDDVRVKYTSRRRSRVSAEFDGEYRPAGSVFMARPGTLDYFLTERYCLYGVGHTGRPYRLEIHHPPWLLQTADATFSRNTVAHASGIPLPDRAPLLLFAKRQDTIAWPPARLQDTR